MMRFATLALPCLMLAGCVQAGGTAFYGSFEIPPRGTPAFCERYADQTFRSTYENLRDPQDGFGPNAIARVQAERQAARSFDRCLAGRTN